MLHHYINHSNQMRFYRLLLTTNRKLITEVCDLLIASGMNIRWRCTSRIDCVDEELLLKMKESGLVEIELGIETGSLRMQKLTKKNLNLQHAQKLISFMLKQGLLVGLFFMYGFPEETEEDLNQTLELLFNFLDQGVTRATMGFLHFSPATQITIDNLDKLTLDTNYRIVFRGIFGWQNEMEMIKSNKTIFSNFYNLQTVYSLIIGRAKSEEEINKILNMY